MLGWLGDSTWSIWSCELKSNSHELEWKEAPPDIRSRNGRYEKMVKGHPWTDTYPRGQPNSPTFDKMKNSNILGYDFSVSQNETVIPVVKDNHDLPIAIIIAPKSH